MSKINIKPKSQLSLNWKNEGKTVPYNSAIKIMEQTVKTKNPWGGDAKPFAASYGKLMMWFFLISDAFTFSAFLGTVIKSGPNGWIGAVICLMAIFLPSFFLILGVLPFWDSLGKLQSIAKGLLGINAAVVGLLIAAFYNPLWINGILSINDFILAMLAFLLLVFWRIPPFLVVCFSALGGWLTQIIIL